MGVCRRHWPQNTATKKLFGRDVPIDPPSIFLGCPDSFQRRTVSEQRREIHSRRVSASARTEYDELPQFEEQDLLPLDFSTFSHEITQKEYRDIVVIKSDEFVRLLSFDSNFEEIEYSLIIRSDFTLSGFRKHTKVSFHDLRNVLGFQMKISRWSQIDAAIVHVKNSKIELNCEITAVTKKLLNIIKIVDCESANFEFLLEQLQLNCTSPENRRYSSYTTIQAMKFYLVSRSAYRLMRNVLCLPHPITLTRALGDSQTVGSEALTSFLTELYASNVSKFQSNCILLFDEVYVKPSLRFRWGHVVGYSVDFPEKLARTVLAFMLKPIFGGKSLIVRFLPVYKLDAEFLMRVFLQIIRQVEEAGVVVRGIMSDNLSVNGKLHKKLIDNFESASSFKIPHPNNQTRFLYLLFDSVHLLKSIRNNWITEKTQTLKFVPPGQTEEMSAKWSDIKELHNLELTATIRRTAITEKAVYPTSFEKQNVGLVTQIFNDKTVAALAQDDKQETASFIFNILRMWKILNNKSLTAYLHMNDNDRKPVTSISQLSFLRDVRDMFNNMSPVLGKVRKTTLTKETRSSLIQTLDGIVDLSETLLQDQNVEYILLGNLQSDDLEGEFGIYRQMFGGLYKISYEQILIAAKFRILSLFHTLEVDCTDIFNHSDTCCNSPISENELDIIDDIHAMVDKLSNSERNTFFMAQVT